MRRTLWLLAVSMAIVLALAGFEAAAQDVGESFRNLQVLDKNITKDELKATMNGFADQLDVKCTYCHIPDEYWKDDKEHKRAAREMIKLVRYLRENRDLYFPKDAEDELISCWTCHRGDGGEIEKFVPPADDDW